MKRFYMLLPALSLAACTILNDPQTRPTLVVADSAMVVCAHPLASRVGLEVLQDGGNAVDASIAVQLALAVVYPAAGNIGGGGFMVFRQRDGKVYTLDYRERAPARATTNM